MAKKLLALVSALALLVCAVSVFTIVSVSADAAFDEFVAAEVEKHPAQLSEFSSNDDYWSGMWAKWLNGDVTEEPVYGINIAAGANGGVTVAVKGAGSAKLGATLNSEYVLNGTHMVISAVTSETNTGFAIMFGSEKGGTPGTADSSTTGIVAFDFNAGTAVSNNHGSSRALSVIEASDVIKAMTAGASVISWGVAEDGVVSVTVTNAAGTVTGSIQDYPAAWTDRTKAYFSIVASGIEAKTNSVDVLAIHGGNETCGADVEEEPAGPTLNTTEIIAGDSKFYKVNTDVIVSNNSYHTGANIKLSDNDDGGVHCVLTAVGSARLGYNYTKEVTLNGTHVVISGLTATDEFAFILGKEPSVSDCDHPAKSIVILTANGNVGVQPGATQENPSIIEGSDSVRAFFNGVTTLISFAVDANGTVSVTVANEAGVTTGTFSGYGEAWEDHTKAYIGFATNSANGVREFDIVAVHDGSVECGETVNPDEAPVKAVEKLIDAIGEEITLNSKDAIIAAVAAYEALSDSQKALVANLDKLVAAVDAYSAIHYDQFRYKYNITVKVQKEEIDGYSGCKYDLETFDENNGLYVDHWMPTEEGMWANRAGYDFAVPLDGLQIVIKDFKSVKEAGQTISIGLMNDPGAWVDADAMIIWLLNSGKRETEGAGEYGYLHAESKKNGLAISKALWQTDFATDIWAADELVIEFAYDAEGQTVGVFVNGQFMGDCTMEDLGITDPNKVIPHFGVWGVGNCKYAVYSITSKAQADKIQAAIDAIEALDPEAADFEEQVEAAADLYKALDKNLRGYVTNYDKLSEAIESIDPSDPTEEPTEDPTEDPTEEPENPKTGEAVAVLPIALLIAAAGAVIISRKRK